MITFLSIGLSLYEATKIKALSGSEKFLHPKNPIQKTLDWRNEELYNYPYKEIDFNWGVKPFPDHTGDSQYDLNSNGRLVYEPDFSITNEEN